MHVHRFPTGGFVLHGVRISESRLRVSAWFDANGRLLDAEGFDSRSYVRPIRRGSALWQRLEVIGQAERIA